MINYYYEINEGVSLFGRNIRYLSIMDVKPDTIGWRHLHEESLNNSRRVWLENANGIKLVMEDGRDVHKPVDSYLITWLKLICQDIETL